MLSLGNALQSLHRLEDAAEQYQRVLDREPHHFDALRHLSRVLVAGQCWAEAGVAAERAAAVRPDDPRALERLYYARSLLCDWRQRAAMRQQQLQAVKEHLAADKASPLPPANGFRLADDPQLQVEIARDCARRLYHEMAEARTRHNFQHSRTLRDGRLRIAYVSGGFRDYPFGHLSRRLYALHDRRRFEVFAYSLEPDDGSEYRQQIAADCDHFVDSTGHSPVDIARRIAEDGIHVLVAHDTMLTGNAIRAVALRPAPVQVSWLYPGPCGAELVDYILTDRVVTPAGSEQFYPEQPVFLPNTHYVTDNTQAIADDAPERRDVGLPDDGFVFCCFNLVSKIEPEMFDVWMRILSQVPGSVLWLLSDLAPVHENLRREAECRSVDGDRIVFATRQPKALHLARHRHAGLFLDTLPYNAHTTAVDAMWAGLPLITCPGRAHAARVAASIVTAAGMPGLIVADLDQYERHAVHLATHPEELGRLREEMVRSRDTCPLFDTERFVRDLEAAFQTIWQRFLGGP